MKLLLLLLLAFGVVWYLRGMRRGPSRPARRRPAAGQPQPMVACAWCAVHVAQQEALPGRDGNIYCSAEHRRLAESA